MIMLYVMLLIQKYDKKHLAILENVRRKSKRPGIF